MLSVNVADTADDFMQCFPFSPFPSLGGYQNRGILKVRSFVGTSTVVCLDGVPWRVGFIEGSSDVAAQ